MPYIVAIKSRCYLRAMCSFILMYMYMEDNCLSQNKFVKCGCKLDIFQCQTIHLPDFSYYKYYIDYVSSMDTVVNLQCVK